MSSKFGKLGDDLMKVPKLEAGGTNWVVYKDRLLLSIDARGLLEHVDGSEREPICPVKPRMVPKKDDEGKDTAEFVRAALTAEEERLMKEWKVEVKEWKQGEAIAKQQIAATIPDSLFMKICDKGTALEIWEALQGDFQNKSRMVTVDLRRRLQQERCVEKGDVRAHFDKLRTMREDLAAMGHTPGDDEFYAIILGSLPYSFEPFISALNATSSVMGTILSPDELMQALTDEYDRRNLGRLSNSKKEENAAFNTNDGNEKGKGRNFKRGCCYNCGKPGHRKDDCWEEGGGMEGQKPNWLKEKEKWQKEKEEDNSNGKKDKFKGNEPATKESAAKARVVEEDVAWMALCPSDSDSDSEDGNKPILFSSDEISLDDLLEVDEELRNEMSKGEQTRKEYSIQNPESLDWWDEPVEGKRDDAVNERANSEGNQPISQPAEPEIEPEEVGWNDKDLPATEAEREPKCEDLAWPKTPQIGEDTAEIEISSLDDPEIIAEDAGKQFGSREKDPTTPREIQLPLAQPKEQGKSRGKAASSEDGEGVDEVGWGIDILKNMAEEPARRRKVCLETAERRKVNSEEEGRHKVCPSAADDTKSARHSYTVQIPAQSNFDDPEFISRRMDLENSLTEGQPPATRAEIAKTANLPYREGIGPLTHIPKPNSMFPIAFDAITPGNLEEPPQMSTGKPRGDGERVSCINARKQGKDATCSATTKHDFRDLQEKGNINMVSKDENTHLPDFQDPGGEPHHREVGYEPMLEDKSSLDQSKGTHDAMWTMEDEGDMPMPRNQIINDPRPRVHT
jgi:hypothetical protein